MNLDTIVTLFPGRVTLSIEEACQALGVSRDFFYDDVKRGKVRFVKTGGRSRIFVDDFVAWTQTFRASDEPQQ